MHSRTTGWYEKVFENIFVADANIFWEVIIFKISTETMQSERLYEVEGELVNFGKKHCVVRCPRTMKAFLDANLQWFPIAKFSKQSRDEEDPKNTVTFFEVVILDKFFTPAAGEDPKTLDVRLQVPESLTDDVSYDVELNSVTLTATSDAARQYISDVNDLLMCWFPAMAQKRDDPTAPVTFNSLTTSVGLKWPWKKLPATQYFGEFNKSQKLHMIELGVGYYTHKRSAIGVSLRLSQFPGLTKRGAVVENVRRNETASKKRKMVDLDENGKEIVVAAPVQGSV